MKTTMLEMINTQYGINDRLDIAKEKISKIEDITWKIIQNESHSEKNNCKKPPKYHSSNLIYV